MYGGKFAFQNRLGLLIVGRKLTVFALFYFVFEDNFPAQDPGGPILEGRLHGGFFVLRVWGSLYMEGLILEFYGSFSMGFKYGRIAAVTKAN